MGARRERVPGLSPCECDHLDSVCSSSSGRPLSHTHGSLSGRSGRGILPSPPQPVNICEWDLLCHFQSWRGLSMPPLHPSDCADTKSEFVLVSGGKCHNNTTHNFKLVITDSDFFFFLFLFFYTLGSKLPTVKLLAVIAMIPQVMW